MNALVQWLNATAVCNQQWVSITVCFDTYMTILSEVLVQMLSVLLE